MIMASTGQDVAASLTLFLKLLRYILHFAYSHFSAYLMPQSL